MAASAQRTRWTIVALVFAAVMLNYVDRQIVALLKPMLQDEFGWSDRAYAHMASVFQLAGALAYLVAGLFIDRVGLRRGFACGVAMWSLAAAAHAVVSTVGGFLATRVVLGVAEATGTPAAVKTAATYFEPAERARVIGISNIAPSLGAVLAPLLIPPVAIAFGWRAAFLAAGALGLVWVAAWLAVRSPPVPPRTGEDGAGDTPRVGWAALAGSRQLWAIAPAKAATDQVWWFLLFFMPDLFHRMFALPQGTLGLPVALVYAMAGFGSYAGGWLSGRLARGGRSPAAARKGALLVFALLVLPLPLLLELHDPWAAALLLGLALFAHQGFSTNLFALATDVFPTAAVASAIGLAAFAGNLAGMAALEFAGWSLAGGHGYAPMLIADGIAYLLALAWVQIQLPGLHRFAPGSAVLSPASSGSHS